MNFSIQAIIPLTITAIIVVLGACLAQNNKAQEQP